MIETTHCVQMSRRHQQPLHQRAQAGPDQERIGTRERTQPGRGFHPEQAAHVRGREHRLQDEQKTIAPAPEGLPILRIERSSAVAAQQVTTQMTLAIRPPARVRQRQAVNPEAAADPPEHVIQLAPLGRTQASRQQLVRPLGIVDEHVEHVAVCPIRNALTTLALDGLVDRTDAIERACGARGVREHDAL